MRILYTYYKVCVISDYEKLALVLLGSCPGGANSNFWTAIFDGDVNLSVTMTLISTIASFGMTTLWAYLLGNPLLTEGTIKIPYHLMAISLALCSIPLALGLLIKYKSSEKAERIAYIMGKPFFFVCLLILPIFAMANNKHMFYLLGSWHLLAGFLLGLCGYLFGAGMGLIARQGKAQVIAISLETAMQNGIIAFVVVSMVFPSPASDIGLLPIIAFFLTSTGPIMFVFYGCYLAYRCGTGKTTIKKIKEELEAKKRLSKGKVVKEEEENELPKVDPLLAEE